MSAAFSAASDVYTLGLLLSRLLTGKRPFPAAGGEPTPPRKLCPACPRGLEGLLLGMLSPVPHTRPVLWVPRVGDLDLHGIHGTHVAEDDVDLATRVDYHEWRQELESQQGFFAQFGERIPRSLLLWRELLLARLNGLPS